MKTAACQRNGLAADQGPLATPPAPIWLALFAERSLQEACLMIMMKAEGTKMFTGSRLSFANMGLSSGL